MGLLFITHNLSIVKTGGFGGGNATRQVRREPTRRHAALRADPSVRKSTTQQRTHRRSVPLPMGGTPLLEMDRLRVAFPIRKAFTRSASWIIMWWLTISVSPASGETLGLVGESGSGKVPPVWRCYGLSLRKAASCLTVNRWIR